MVPIVKCAKMDFSVMLWLLKSPAIHQVVKFANVILSELTLTHGPHCLFALHLLETAVVRPMSLDKTATSAKMVTLTLTVVKDATLAIGKSTF